MRKAEGDTEIPSDIASIRGKMLVTSSGHPTSKHGTLAYGVSSADGV